MLTRRHILSCIPFLSTTIAHAADATAWDEAADGRDPIYREDSLKIELRPTLRMQADGTIGVDTVSPPQTCRSFACWKPVEDHPWLMGEVTHWDVRSRPIELQNLSRRARLECADHWAFREAFGCWPYQAAAKGLPFSRLVWILGERFGDGRSVAQPWNFTKATTSRAEWIRSLQADTLPRTRYEDRAGTLYAPFCSSV